MKLLALLDFEKGGPTCLFQKHTLNSFNFSFYSSTCTVACEKW